MKNIMFIMTTLGAEGWGGAHKVSVMLANYLSENGYNVTFSVSEKSKVAYPVDEAIKVVYLSDIYKQTNVRQVNLVKKLISFRNLCKRNNIDIVIGFTSNMAIYSVLATVLSKRRAIISERTDPRIEPKRKLLRGLRNIIFCLADKVVFQTPGARNYYPKTVKSMGVIIPNPISENIPQKYSGERERKIVNFCRIAPQKNLKVLLSAFDIFSRNHTDYELEIYGDAKSDTYKNEIKLYAENLSCSDKIHFYPACSDVHSRVRKARMFASSSDYEGISNSMLEAMALGLPVIVTDCENGGERMCIENEKNGVIVPRREPNTLAEMMGKIADDDNFAEALSSNAVKLKGRFAVDKIFSEWKKIIEEV